MRRSIAVLTTSRADYSHLFWVLRDMQDHPAIDMRLLVTAAHLSPEFGSTIERIEADGFRVAERVECLLDSDTDVGMAKTIGLATLGLADALGRLRPDLLLLIADRYEMLAPAAVALALRIPVAHIEGGEVSEGAIDDAVRNALTKLSHLHFTPTETARRRVLALGEEEWRVHRTGAPSLDHLRRSRLPSREELAAQLEVELREDAVVVAYHPVTLARDTLLEADEVFAALERIPRQLIFCFPNADAGSRALERRVRLLVGQRSDSRLFVNLPPASYWGLLRCAAMMVGNSSSGIMETPSLALPTVNIGIRQRGRERAANVIDAEARCDAILAAVERAAAPTFRRDLAGMANPYGDGNAARRIVEALAGAPTATRLLQKPPVTPLGNRSPQAP